MRLLRLVCLASFLSLGACMLPRPVDRAVYLKGCEQAGRPDDNALLFVTIRLPDCRKQGLPALTWHRGDGLMYGAWGTDNRVRFFSRDSWTEALEDRLKARKALIYIHGFHNSNAAALGRAATIRTAIANAREVITFTWPSYDRTAKYFWDETNAEWTGDLARDFVHELGRSHPGIVLVAHSMGNRIALDALSGLPAGQNSVERLIMASPDVDRAVLERRLKAGLGMPVTLYGSRRDQPLSASWRSHGYPRAGDFATWVTGHKVDYTLQDIRGVDFVDTSFVTHGLMHHADFAQSAEAIADLCRVVLNRTPELGRQAVPGHAGRSILLPGGPADNCRQNAQDALDWLSRKRR